MNNAASDAMHLTRRHRFPPYRGEEELEQELVDDNAPKFEDGFQQGVEMGHQEGLSQGHQQGLVQGQQEGQQQGFIQGQNQGKQLFTESLALLATSQTKVDQLSRHKLVEQQGLIADLVAQVGRRVVRAELTLNPKQVLTLVEEAMQSLTDEVDKVRVFLNPDDKKRLAELGVEQLNDWPLEEDSELAIGDCFIRSSQMEIAVDTAERFDECISHVQQTLVSTDEPEMSPPAVTEASDAVA